MNFVRKSVLLTNDDSEPASSIGGSNQSSEESESAHTACAQMCADILPLVVDEKFRSKYYTLPIGIPDCYVFSHRSLRCLILEAVTLFPSTQIENLHTYKFTTHPFFEEKLAILTNYNGEKPNPVLVRSRSWDVALNVVMKIEAVPMPYACHNYLLKREYKILRHMWATFMDRNLNIDEMTGIPMIYEFVEVPNDTYNAHGDGHQVMEIDTYGKYKLLRFNPTTGTRSTLSYMTMEKLGPSISYLQQLMRASQVQPKTFDLWTALKVFDQLICRILQVQKLGIIHNNVCPYNVYLGNGATSNVVYLNGFKRAYTAIKGDKDGPGGLSSPSVGNCNVRFASVGQLNGSARHMRPIDDVESIFYMLLSMLNADALPWDSLLRQENSTSGHRQSARMNQNLDQGMALCERNKVSLDTLKKVLEFKQRFWNSNRLLNLVLSSSACVFSSDEHLSTSVPPLIRELYFRVKEMREAFRVEDSFCYCTSLSRNSSEEFRQLMELRKCALAYFKFSEVFDIINDIRFRKRLDDELIKNVQQPWDALVWCFNNIEVKAELKSQVQQPVTVAPRPHSFSSTA